MLPPNMKVIAFIIYGIQKQWNTVEYYGKLSKPPSKMRNGQSPCQTKKDTIAVWLSFLGHFPRKTYKYPCQYIYI